MDQKFDFFAFISYKREDERWAVWLQRKLEYYKLPTAIAKVTGSNLPKRLKPVFKDTTDIKPGVLPEVLKHNLDKSQYLIVVCSPRSARSQWVGKEISDFIALGKMKQIILFVVDGIPYSNNPETECYHSVIKDRLPEMLGVNIKEEGRGWRCVKRQKAFIRIVSTLLGVSFDSLWQRQKRRLIRSWIINILTGLLFLLVLIGVSIYQYKVNQPFDVDIRLKETSYHNKNLPFENGYVYLHYDQDTLVSKQINNYSDAIVFCNIPGKFRNKKANIRFTMQGFHIVDSMVNLSEKQMIMIRRDSIYGIIRGNVCDYTGRVIADAKIIIRPIETKTDKNGNFEICIPSKGQTVTKEVQILKKGYKPIIERYLVGTQWRILLESK